MKGSSNEVLPDVSLKDAAASGCKKCHQELSSGLKTSMPHGTSCPRGPGDLVTLSAPSDPKQSLQNNKVKASLEEAAASGCKKCQNELATGVKTRISHANGCLRSQNPCKECQNEVTTGFKTREPHGNECPRNHNPQRNYHTVSLKDAAASGCKKCQRELVSRKKTAYSHDDGCPRKSKPRVGDKTKMPTNEEEVIKATVSLKDAAVACKKCQRELATGLTSSFQHSAGCPLKAGSTSPSSSNKSDKSPRFHVGTLVFVKSRTWPGVNKLGGVARVTKVHVPSSALDCVKYDVAYVIETRREKSIEEKFVSLHTDYVSPSKDMSLVHRADELDFSASDNEQSDQEKNKLPSSNNVSPAKKKRTVSDTENNDAGELIVLSSAEKKDADGNPLSDCKFSVPLQISIHFFSQILL
jgi:RNase P subunit RPR2